MTDEIIFKLSHYQLSEALPTFRDYARGEDRRLLDAKTSIKPSITISPARKMNVHVPPTVPV